MEKITNFLEIDDLSSWPADFLDILNENKKLLVEYHLKESAIDNECRDNVFLRIKPPINPFRKKYEEIVDSLEEVLIKYSLLAYHCTRLTKEEIATIKSNGMKVLSNDFINKKLANLIPKYLSDEQYKYIFDKKCTNPDGSFDLSHRAGRIWFCPNRSTLKEEHSVYRLFKSWGGEAVYVDLENDKFIADSLTKIGTPCIIKCLIDFKTGVHFDKYSERFISKIVETEIEYPEPPSDFDLSIQSDLQSNRVLEIIEFGSSDFELLTAYTEWDFKIG